jgi:hypothetical protein
MTIQKLDEWSAAIAFTHSRTVCRVSLAAFGQQRPRATTRFVIKPHMQRPQTAHIAATGVPGVFVYFDSSIFSYRHKP